MDMQAIILLYSKYSVRCRDPLSLINNSKLKNIVDVVCIDNPNVRKRIISSTKMHINIVPCILVLHHNGVVEKYDGIQAMSWVENILKLNFSQSQAVSVDQTIQATPINQVIQQPLGAQTIQAVPQNQVLQQPLGAQTMQAVPQNQVLQQPLGVQTIQAVPQNQVMQAVPQNQVMQVVPQNQVLQQPLGVQTIQAVPQNQVIQAVPQNQVIQAVPQNQVMQAVPQNQVIQAVPQNQVMQAVPQLPFNQSHRDSNFGKNQRVVVGDPSFSMDSKMNQALKKHKSVKEIASEMEKEKEQHDSMSIIR